MCAGDIVGPGPLAASAASLSARWPYSPGSRHEERSQPPVLPHTLQVTGSFGKPGRRPSPSRGTCNQWWQPSDCPPSFPHPVLATLFPPAILTGCVLSSQSCADTLSGPVLT